TAAGMPRGGNRSTRKNFETHHIRIFTPCPILVERRARARRVPRALYFVLEIEDRKRRNRAGSSRRLFGTAPPPGPFPRPGLLGVIVRSFTARRFLARRLRG